MSPSYIAIQHEGAQFSHEDACRVSEAALGNQNASLVVVDLNAACDATTSAFARLILLRRALLRSGRDLRLAGLHDRAAHLHQVSRLDRVLPVFP